MDLTVNGEPLIAFLLASVRIAAWLVIVPPFSAKSIPNMAKVVLSVGLALAAAPSLHHTQIPTGTYSLVVSAATQAAIGAAMGFVTFLLFTAISAAGSLIDVFGGFSLASGFDPLGLNSNTIFGNFHQMIATMLLFATNAHMIVIGGLLSTFRFLPVGATPHLAHGEDVVVTAFKMFFTTAVQIALPMIVVLFLADLGLALMTKIAPQLQAMNVMFPAKIGLTLLLLGLSFPVLPPAMERLVDYVQQATAALAGAG